jgi:hypothetical protein
MNWVESQNQDEQLKQTALQAFANIAKLWELSEREQAILLGEPSQQIARVLTGPIFWYHPKVESLDHITARRASLGFVEFQRTANSRGVA